MGRRIKLNYLFEVNESQELLRNHTFTRLVLLNDVGPLYIILYLHVKCSKQTGRLGECCISVLLKVHHIKFNTSNSFSLC